MKKKIIIWISVILVFALLGIVLFFMSKSNSNLTNDEIKFKEEYESINGVELNEEYTLKNIDIEADNNVKYVSDNEIINLLTKGSNIIYFGWPDCNWCRTVIPVLLDTIKVNNIDVLYYYNFKELRQSYEEKNDDNKIEIYNKIIDIIGKDVESVFDDNSNSKGEKKILAPSVIFIKNGTYIGMYSKFVNSQENSIDSLNKNQILELKNNYQRLIDQFNVNVCPDEGC